MQLCQEETMNSRERVNCAFRHIEPDRTPIFEYVLTPPLSDRILGRPMCLYEGFDNKRFLLEADENGLERAIKRYIDERLDLAMILGHDMLFVCPNPVPGARKQNLYFELETIPEDELDKSLEPAVAAIRSRNARESMRCNVDDHFIVYPMLKDEMKNRGLDLPILAPVCTHGIWTDVDLMETMILSPDDAKEHFRICTEKALDYARRLLEADVDIYMAGGDFAGNQLLISPPSYREFIMPEIRNVSRYIHENGKWVVNASDGLLCDVIDDFLFGCEVDAYNEIDMHAGMSLKHLKQMYGDRITLFGNMDSGNILCLYPPEKIYEETIKCIKDGWGNGGHIFSASNAIAEITPMENYMAMINAYRDYFGLSRVIL
jgi:hypothetical protein